MPNNLAAKLERMDLVVVVSPVCSKYYQMSGRVGHITYGPMNVIGAWIKLVGVKDRVWFNQDQLEVVN